MDNRSERDQPSNSILTPSRRTKLRDSLTLLNSLSKRALEFRLARGKLIKFTTMTFPQYRPAHHHYLIADYLEALERGDITRLIITMPPRHGKSELASIRFPAWYMGRHPDSRVILTSYSGGLSIDFSRQLRETMLTPVYFNHIFPSVRIDPRSAAGGWRVYKRRGTFLSGGVGSGITGRGADLFIIDDPHKDAKEAHSAAMRRRVWDWYRTTAYTRLMPGGRMLVIGTRWHEEDLIGRLLSTQDSSGVADRWTVLHLPAIDDQNGALSDEQGTALWPEQYSLPDLLRIRSSVGAWVFEALYQGRPTIPEGAYLKIQDLSKFVDVVPVRGRRIRYWDKAGTAGVGSDATAGVLLCHSDEGLTYIEDVVYGHWETFDRMKVMQATAERDAQKYGVGSVHVWIEQEPGSGGKESAQISLRQLARFPVHAETVSGSKVVRAMPFVAQCQAGNVFLKRGAWNEDYLDELLKFPYGSHDDQVDATSGAYNKLMDQPLFGFDELGGVSGKAPNMWLPPGSRTPKQR